MLTSITIDGTTYRVLVVPDSLKRLAQLVEGPNNGDMFSDRHERDLTGTRYAFSMRIEPDWVNYADYDSFYEVITAPTPTHNVTLPFGQKTISFSAMIDSVEDGLIGEANGVNRWHGMTVTFTPEQPQRRPAT